MISIQRAKNDGKEVYVTVFDPVRLHENLVEHVDHLEDVSVSLWTRVENGRPLLPPSAVCESV